MSGVGETAAVILAAGAGTRFGGGKLRAPLAGRPLLAHVLAAARDAGVGRVVVVLGRDAGAVLDAIRADDPAVLEGVLVAVNAAPERGLASSIRLGFAAATAGSPASTGVLLLLGDQPHVRADVLRALGTAGATAPAGCLAVVPRYADDATPNPVLLLPAGWPLVADLAGDRGLWSVLAGDPARVLRMAVAGTNPDVDTPADLAAVASLVEDRG